MGLPHAVDKVKKSKSKSWHPHSPPHAVMRGSHLMSGPSGLVLDGWILGFQFHHAVRSSACSVCSGCRLHHSTGVIPLYSMHDAVFHDAVGFEHSSSTSVCASRGLFVCLGPLPNSTDHRR